MTRDELRALRDQVAREILIALGENPEAFHTKDAYSSGICLLDHAIPLWRQNPYKSAADAILSIPKIAEGIGMVVVKDISERT